MIGRKLPYLASAAVFGLGCLLIGAVPSPAAVWAGRFVTGFASAVPSVVIAGSIEDLFNTKRRVWVVVLWNVGTTAGLCFGPVYAAYVAHALGWRWVYRSAGIVTLALGAAALLVRESRPSLLLARALRRVRERTPRAALAWHNPDAAPDARTFLELVAVRPARILATEPLVIMVAAISAVSWGIVYLFTETLTDIYQAMGFGRTQASLPFLAVAAGTLFTLFPRLWDMRVVRRRQRRREHVEPYVNESASYFL